MQLSIIIPTKDRAEVFGSTLRCAAAALDQVDAEIIVVNDSKTSRPAVPEELPNVIVIDNPGSGVASARNIGARMARGDVLLFLDNDIIISAESVNRVLQLHAEIEKGCFNLNWEYPPENILALKSSVFGRFLEAHDMTSFRGWYADSSWRENSLFQSKSVASFHLSVRRKDFEKTGGYNEQFPHAGFEDYDFPIRLKKAGLSFYIDSRTTVLHNEGDRLFLDTWLENQQNRAVTRKVAVNLGYTNLRLEYKAIKRLLLSVILFFSGPVKTILAIIPNKTLLDPISFRLIAALQASRIYKGYSSPEKK